MTVQFENIYENLRFMIHETENQLRASHRLFRSSNPSDFEKVFLKDDYVDNLKNLIENECFHHIASNQLLSKTEQNDVRALQTIAVNLERIADQSVNITRQLGYLGQPDFIDQFDYAPLFQIIHEGLEKIMTVYQKRDLQGALDICKIEPLIDQLYKKNFDKIMESLSGGTQAKDLITVLFIFRYLERIGDLILNIGEALILAIVGEKIKIHQFESLQDNLERTGFEGTLNEIDFQAILGSRSGCRISKVGKNVSKTKESIFKEGSLKKIKSEKESLVTWNKLFPGLVPRIFSYQEEGENASMLVEFLHGCTLDEIILCGDDDSLQNALFVLKETSKDIWLATKRQEKIRTDYIQQLLERCGHVQQVHPEFVRHEQNIGLARVLDTASLFKRSKKIEEKLPAPFSVRIHGDFNINNLVFNPEEQKIHYIDLYRSRQADYIQDISVFLISNFRIPVYEKKIRDRLNHIIENYYQYALKLADELNDKTFGARLSLALARSFYTSTRFETNKQFGEEMFLRSHFLLDKLLLFDDRGHSWTEYTMNDTVLYY
jgi:phosphate uptake regulator